MFKSLLLFCYSLDTANAYKTKDKLSGTLQRRNATRIISGNFKLTLIHIRTFMTLFRSEQVQSVLWTKN